MKKKSIKEKILDALEEKGRKISINPPPQNGKCECCGEHLSGLKPFGKAGDPLVGDFDGALLVKIFRSMAPKQEMFDISDCMGKDGYLDEEKFVKKYGKENLEEFYFRVQLENSVSASWECRDCIILGDDGYFKLYFKKIKNEKGKKHKRKDIKSP